MPNRLNESHKRRATRIWAKFILIFFPLTVVWALANPMFASPDEPSHMIRAQGVIHGDLKSPYITDGIPKNDVDCMAFYWDITANCMKMEWGAPKTPMTSPTDTYPPLFHGLAGIPSLFLNGLVGAYATRIWLALICAMVIAWSGTLLWTRRPNYWSIGGLIAASTPMVVFTFATVNPSGITAALSSTIWAGGLNLSLPTSGTMKRASRITFMIAVVLFPFLRRDALAWEIAILAILATTLSRARLKDLRQDRLIIGSLIVTLANMVWVWIAWASTATDSFVSNSADHGGGSWAAGLGSVYLKILEVIGYFGWLDSPMTSESFVFLMSLLAGVITIAALGGHQKEARTTIIAFFGMLSAPVIIGAVRFPYLQGRYLFPIWVGCMVVAGQALAASKLPDEFNRRFFRFVSISLAVIHFVAFAQNLRRYAVGRSGTWKFYQHSMWHPPMMSNLTALILAFTALIVAVLSGRNIIKSESLKTDNQCR